MFEYRINDVCFLRPPTRIRETGRCDPCPQRIAWGMIRASFSVEVTGRETGDESVEHLPVLSLSGSVRDGAGGWSFRREGWRPPLRDADEG